MFQGSDKLARFSGFGWRRRSSGLAEMVKAFGLASVQLVSGMLPVLNRFAKT